MNKQMQSSPAAALRTLATNKLAFAVAAIIVLFVFGEIISPGFLSFNT